MKNKILSYFICLLLVIISLLIIIDIACFQRSFYKYEYQKANIYQQLIINEEDMSKVTNTLIDYIKDKNDNLNVEVMIDNKKEFMFNEREISHMVDVKNLYQNAMNFRNICCLLLIISMICFSLNNNNIFTYLYIAYKKLLLTISAILSSIFTYAIIDFYNFWTNFHHLFFSNDLWLLNPRTDRMILMLPGTFFSDLIMLIIFSFIIILGIIYFIFKFLSKKESFD